MKKRSPKSNLAMRLVPRHLRRSCQTSQLVRGNRLSQYIATKNFAAQLRISFVKDGARSLLRFRCTRSLR